MNFAEVKNLISNMIHEVVNQTGGHLNSDIFSNILNNLVNKYTDEFIEKFKDKDNTKLKRLSEFKSEVCVHCPACNVDYIDDISGNLYCYARCPKCHDQLQRPY